MAEGVAAGTLDGASRGLRPRERSVRGEIFFGSDGCDAGLGEKNTELGEKIE